MPARARLEAGVDAHGARLVLDQPTDDDVDAITDHCQDPAVQAWTVVPAPYERQHAVDFVAAVENGWGSGAELTWAIRLDGALVGMIGLRTQPVRSAEIGYWLASEARGRGVMHRAVVAVVDHAFDPDGLGLDRLEWRAFHGNEASRRVAERAGFRVEGLVRGEGLQRGVRRDSWVGTLLRTDPRLLTA